MGTGRPHVEITAATLAGGRKNQDRYAYGDGWAFVLDGASSFAKTRPEHDGGWYAQQLSLALSVNLETCPELPTPEIVKAAIHEVARLHGEDAASCPTSTVALARWDSENVEAYVLGDSTAALIRTEAADDVLSDTRIADIATPLRELYRSRLRAGHGFDERHHDLLQQLQLEQAVARNRPDGFWIAGAVPTAAHWGVSRVHPRTSLRCLVLATDGAASGRRYGVISSWLTFVTEHPADVLRRVHEAEASDPRGQEWPRSKAHDDKTVVAVAFTSDGS